VAGFFLHIPFPSSEVYKILPCRAQLLEGMLSCDLVGFHTWDYSEHFVKTCTRILGAETQFQAVIYRDRRVPGALHSITHPKIHKQII
jgi:trehalose-6-phosphate synthase